MNVHLFGNLGHTSHAFFHLCLHSVVVGVPQLQQEKALSSLLLSQLSDQFDEAEVYQLVSIGILVLSTMWVLNFDLAVVV